MNGTPARRPKSAFSETGVRIKEVSDGRPCDNCPELCPGFIPHAWRKTCKSCGCDRLKHSVYHEELGSVRDRLGLRESRVNHHSYDSPPGLTAKQTELYWSSLAECTPSNVGGATGQAAWRAWRTRALASQLPKQDLSLAHCRHVDEAHRKQYEDFVAARNEIALDIGVASQHHGSSMDCMGCNKQIRSGNITIQAPRIGEDAYFHPACFVCSECDELLVELAYCALDGRLYCVRHYSERLKPRCHSCDETANEMGLLLSIIITYAGVKDAIECLKHNLTGVVPSTQPDIQDLVDHYLRLLKETANSSQDWTNQPQGYIWLTEDKKGNLHSASVKYYNGQPDSTALLFSTKKSSFGQDSIEDPISNGNYKYDRPSPTRTKTIVSNSSESFNVDRSNKTNTILEDVNEKWDEKDKLTWHYEPQSPNNEPPEIRFQSYDDDKPNAYNEEYLRSLDGLKVRPLQRNDPSGRRRSFRKRNSSSSSSKESRASREEELNMFTSLEESEFERMKVESSGFGSAPNLSAPYRSRSVSRERRKENWSVEASVDSIDEESKSKTAKLDSAEDPKQESEVIEEEEIDFWGMMGD